MCSLSRLRGKGWGGGASAYALAVSAASGVKPASKRLKTVIQDLLEGQYYNPIGVFGFNPWEGWSRDVSADVAQELRRRCDLQLREGPSNIQDFVERHEKRGGR